MKRIRNRCGLATIRHVFLVNNNTRNGLNTFFCYRSSHVLARFLPSNCHSSTKTISTLPTCAYMAVFTANAHHPPYMSRTVMENLTGFFSIFFPGLSLYFNLARHAFGDVQKILFPKYFSLNSLLSAITLIQFGKMHVAAEMWDVHTYLQVHVWTLYTRT